MEGKEEGDAENTVVKNLCSLLQLISNMADDAHLRDLPHVDNALDTLSVYVQEARQKLQSAKEESARLREEDTTLQE